ncbi:helix-turn-helix domain-containing protein [Myroides sp. LJL119]
MQTKDRFETFTPKCELVKKYVEYYYLDYKHDSTLRQIDCFPHYKSTLSLYRSHLQNKDKEVVFDPKAGFLQIYTTVRDSVLKVRQFGRVFRIVIVFYPLGVQQFFKKGRFNEIAEVGEFFTNKELEILFKNCQQDDIRELLDSFLSKRFIEVDFGVLSQGVQRILGPCPPESIAELAQQLLVSRQHLNRLFKTNLGVSAKRFQLICLFRKTLEYRLQGQDKDSFTRIANSFFSDQSHFNKVYKDLTNHNPKDFYSKGSELGDHDIFWHVKQ